MFKAYLPYLWGECVFAIKVYEHNGTGGFGNGCPYFSVVYLECVLSRLHEHSLQMVFGNGEYGGNIGVGWHYHLIAFLHLS